LDRQLQALGRALRPLAHDLPGIFSYRLLYDRFTEGFEIACSQKDTTIKRGFCRFTPLRTLAPIFPLRHNADLRLDL